MRRALLVSALGFGLALAGCGQSEQDKAKEKVCDARADIQKKVADLQALPLSAASVDQLKSDLNAIKDDLKTISDQQDKLDDTRKQQVQKANETFTSQVQALTQDVRSGRSLESAPAQLKSDLAALANAYKSAFAPIDC